MAQQVSVSLDPKHIRIVEKYRREIGVRGFSTALQSMILQFDRTQKTDEPVTPPPPEPPVSSQIPEPVAA